MDKKTLRALRDITAKSLPMWTDWKTKAQFIPARYQAILALLDSTITRTREEKIKWERHAIECHLSGHPLAAIIASLKSVNLMPESRQAVINLIWAGDDSFVEILTRKMITLSEYYCPFCDGRSLNVGESFNGKVCRCIDEREFRQQKEREEK